MRFEEFKTENSGKTNDSPSSAYFQIFEEDVRYLPYTI